MSVRFHPAAISEADARSAAAGTRPVNMFIFLLLLAAVHGLRPISSNFQGLRPRSAGRGTDAGRGASAGRGTGAGRGASAGRYASAGRDVSAGRGVGAGRGAGAGAGRGAGTGRGAAGAPTAAAATRRAANAEWFERRRAGDSAARKPRRGKARGQRWEREGDALYAEVSIDPSVQFPGMDAAAIEASAVRRLEALAELQPARAADAAAAADADADAPPALEPPPKGTANRGAEGNRLRRAAAEQDPNPAPSPSSLPLTTQPSPSSSPGAPRQKRTTPHKSTIRSCGGGAPWGLCCVAGSFPQGCRRQRRSSARLSRPSPRGRTRCSRHKRARAAC